MKQLKTTELNALKKYFRTFHKTISPLHLLALVQTACNRLSDTATTIEVYRAVELSALDFKTECLKQIG